MKVKNVNGTAQARCACGTWLGHWQKFSGYTANYCVANGCANTDLVGAHVQKAGDGNWYIVPLCNAHNQSSRELDIFDSCPLVSANRSQTCEPPQPKPSYYPYPRR